MQNVVLDLMKDQEHSHHTLHPLGRQRTQVLTPTYMPTICMGWEKMRGNRDQ